MFTGIVQGLVEVANIEEEGTLARLTLAMPPALTEGLQLGASVAVNGTCLTVTHIGNAITFDVIRESLETTNLSRLTSGQHVNVERSFRVGDEIGGHILSGHIAAVAEVVAIEQAPQERNLTLQVDAQWMKYLQHKGFVALDGASITIAWVDHDKDQFGVCLIPETISRTTLGHVTEGDFINVEIDAQTQTVVETVERMLESPEWAEKIRAVVGS